MKTPARERERAVKNKKGTQPSFEAQAPTNAAADEHDELGSGALFPIVGVGASAGGLEAFTQLLAALPRKTGMGFVLVQHLDPNHESALTEILSRSTSLPVREITNEERVRVDHVYVIPPDATLVIAEGVLKLQRRQQTGAPHRSIDTFFESLAQDQRERAVGVVLSGTANDGTMGLEAIKAEGGITFAQDESAKHDSMPRSAVAAGCVDLILSPADIAKELVRIASHPYVSGQSLLISATTPAQADEVDAEADNGREEVAESDNAQDGYQKILRLLRSHSGVDFSLYKPATIQRRVARRLVLNKQSTLHDYASFLRGNAKELDALYSDVLINVTSFFRNPDTFDVLQHKILPELLTQRGDDPLRFWVLACSSGQEAYSIAMAFVEAAEKAPRLRELKVFATDLSEAMLEKARRGLYAKSLVADITPQRLQRFFVETDGGYRINKTVRDMVVFARQNLTADPPFSRVDLISCRNVLIYLEPSAQKKAMASFHFALKPGGFLLLGASESSGGFTHLFERVDRKHKIYSKKPASIQALHLPVRTEHGEELPALRTPITNRRPGGPELPGASAGELNPQREADRITVSQFAPPGVLVNAELQVLQFRGETGAFLEPPPGRPSFDVLKMARNGLMLPLRSAIHQATKENKTARKENVRVKGNGKTRTVTLTVIPLTNLRERCFLILFEEAEKASGGNEPPEPQRARSARSPRGEEKGRIAELETELAETREYLQEMQEQVETANEEFQASSEEVQSANEELQSSNEELETSKEELESANEELATVNDELSNRNVELNRLNSDLLDLQASAKVAIVLLGLNLDIRRFGSHAEKQFHLLVADIGRPVGDIQHNLVRGDTPQSALDLESLCAEVVSGVREQELEVRDKSGRWYSLRVRPHRTLNNKVDGALIVVVDIDTLKRAEEALRESLGHSAADALALGKLNDVSSRLWRMRSLREGLEEMLAVTIDLLGADMGNIQLLDEQRGVLRIEAQSGFQQDFLDFFREVSTEHDSACGRTLRSGERVVIEDVETDAPYAPLRAVARAAGYRAVQSTPLRGRSGAPLGLISTHFRSPHRPTEQEFRRLDLYAHQAAGFIERCIAEETLRKSEEKYRSLFDSVDEGVATVEVLFDDDKAIDYVILETNEAHERMSGMPRTFVGKRVREVMPDIEESIVERVGRVALTGEPIRFEEYVGALGRWFEIYLSRVGGEGSRMVVSLANNITERKRREHHAAFLDTLSQALALLDSPEEIVRAAGEALGAHLDISFVHLVGVKLAPGDEPADAHFTVRATWEREGLIVASGDYRAGDYLSEEFLRAARAGVTIVIRDTDTDPRVDTEAFRSTGIRGVVVVPILEDDEWPGLIAVGTPGVRDWPPDEVALILEMAHRVFPRVERARADAALRASEQEVRRARDYAEATLRTSPVPLLVLEPDLRVHTANDAFYQVFQVSPAETEGRLVYELGNGQWNIPPLRELLEQVLPQHTVLHGFEIVHDFQSIGLRTVLLSARRMDNEALTPQRIVLVLEDITERKQAAEAIRQSEVALREADRRKDEFIAMLAHELRNPLAPIRTGLELIRLAGDTPGSIERIRAMMERQVGHMVRLVDDLLDVSRVTSGKIELQREPTPLEALVNGAIETNRAAVLAKQIALSVELPEALCVLDVDPTRFIQVISNLLHNATKFTEPGGFIRFSARIDGADGGTGRGVSLSIRDSGIGISAELLPRVFDLFTQGDRGSSQPGLGIGLTLARRLMEMHGGDIDVRSDGAGTGSEFVIRLPLSATDVQPHSAEQTPVRTLARRVVVIDDNHDAADATAMLIEQLGGQCRVAYDGVSGIREVLSHRPDAVLLDIGMPGLDGYETCARIRQEVGREVVVVALTGFGQEQDRAHAARAGFDAHLTKPADPKELAKLLSDLLAPTDAPNGRPLLKLPGSVTGTP